ncbi:glycoside hydrolase family 13 protein [Nonomuraea typhae]|uniref:glycoside hydrolase family 13 protein n=1 Tax=Nonomuraea typhae TaxID=2603600 RepID=UPI0012F822B9|nr:glycoside hydrolase family 13 protein [Nonomuraea typhae]
MVQRETLCNTAAHHDGSPLYVSDPSPGLGERVEVFARTADALGTRRVFVRSTPDGEPCFTEALIDRVTPGETWWRATLRIANPECGYRFLLHTVTGPLWLTAAGLSRTEVTDAADFTLAAFPPPPAWAADAVIYQIFPDRFARSDRPRGPLPSWARPAAWDEPIPYGRPYALQQIYGGDLWGAAERLEHIAALGANLIYLTPFFPARSNHRYDAVTFDRVDPLLGGDEALKNLTARAHERGIRVIGDITLNHSGDAHDWFVKARSDRPGPERGFYYFDGDDYATFAGVKSLPKFDHRSPELRRRLDAVIARYPDEFGLDGWRVDVAQSAGRHGGVELNARVAADTRAALGDDRLLLAENQFDASAALRGDGWHGTMAYAGFARPVWSWLARERSTEFWGTPGPIPHYGGGDLAAVMRAYAARIPWRAHTHNLTLLGSHDTARFRSIAGREHQHLGAALLFTLPGLPMVFAGDEVGVEGVHLEDGRRPFPWEPDRQDHGTHRLYRELIALRRGREALRRGGLRWLRADDEVVLFERATAHETLLVQVSRGAHPPMPAPAALAGLLGAPDLAPGEPMPGDGPAFHIWETTR